MILQKDAVDVIINEFQLDERYAGITGYIQDIDPTANILSKIYAMHCAEKKPQEMKSLPGVGIYNTQFIRDKDCFMNPFLKDYEEQELGFRILANNGILKRINVVIVKHNRHMGNSLSVMFRKFRLGYFRGRGQALRFSLKQDINIFLKHMSFLKLYIFLIFWWSLTIITILMNQISFLKIFFAFSGIILFIYILFKKNIAIALHQIISWHLFAIGIIIGFFMGCKSPNSIHIDVVKKIQ